MNISDQRALMSLSRKEGEFSLLLDEQFDIVWHSRSLSSVIPSVLIQQADQALYSAKSSGKNTVCLAS